MALPAASTYPYSSAIAPLPWMEQAVCAQVDPELFFPERGDSSIARSARAICQSCPVRVECLEFGMGEEYGTWGGLSETQRRSLKRNAS